MSADDVRRAITRIAHEILERGHGSERLAIVGRKLSPGRWNGVAVRIAQRVPQPRGEGVSLGRRQPVLMPLGQPVPAGLGHAGLLGEVALPQAVRANHMQGDLTTVGLQGESALSERNQPAHLEIGRAHV